MDLDQGEEEVDNRPANYELKGCITHLGKSPHSGHYVCHIKREGEWVLYNDDKVAVSSDPPLDKAYIYFFKRV